MPLDTTNDYAIILDHIQKRYANRIFGEAWRNLPEVPDKSEIMPPSGADSDSDEGESADSDTDRPNGTRLPHNVISGPWNSKAAYIGAHYRILREDAIADLRSSVAMFKAHPSMDDDKSTCIYTHVHFKGIQASPSGPAFRVEFSYERAGKRIRWEQSTRLVQGTMVALTTHRDLFRSICKIATIAARPIRGGLDQNPPTVDLFWGDTNDVDINPAESYIMIEARSGYFEASRHMLVALQKLMTEGFPLSDHIVNVNRDIGPPAYIEEQPLVNLNSIRRTNGEQSSIQDLISISDIDEDSLDNVNILDPLPMIPDSGMDSSQMAACHRMLAKNIAIIQGPPETGKTFVSVAALRVMLENWATGDPPIIIAAQTNHALDQLLKLVAGFEPNFLRLGGRYDKECVEITKRTLFNLRLLTDFPESQRGLSAAHKALKDRTKELRSDLAPLQNPVLLSSELVRERGILTDSQYESLYDDDWVTADDPNLPNMGLGRMGIWLGQEQIVPIPQCPPINMGLEEEEIDLEFEQLHEIELEAREGGNEKDLDALPGTWIPFQQTHTGRSTQGFSDKKMKKYLAGKKSLWEVPVGWRGEVYRYFERQVYQHMLQILQVHLVAYEKAVKNLKAAKWVRDVNLIRYTGVKLIGCTTTGLSKYRGMLAALMPRTLLIEEAAETLEGTVTAAMFDSLEQLILVGDHQQLRANCSVSALLEEPYNLGISMFERLINNSIEYTMLNVQRRMITDIRKLLCLNPTPFYNNLRDHPFVLDRINNRPAVQGMGGKDTYFFSHCWPESRGSDTSRSNIDEAEMVVGFFNYLVLNGIEPKKITILTFYNGQRKALLKLLRKHPTLASHTYFNVFTVDSFQGEENDIILLSLVRSNNHLGIGFLENKNRLVVALSRARRGLYLFGNAVTLIAAYISGNKIWEPVISAMGRDGRFSFDRGLPITCTKHGKTIEIMEADDWHGNAGGCDQKCKGELLCGHPCALNCHPFDHSQIICPRACIKVLQCGHRCSKVCGVHCHCDRCETGPLPQNSVVAAHSWNSWDPKKADKELEEFQQRQTAAIFQSAQQTIFHETGPLPQNPVVSAHSWNSWDAKKADKALEEFQQRLTAAIFQSEQQTIFHETHRPVIVQNSERIRDPETVERVFQINGEDPTVIEDLINLDIN